MCKILKPIMKICILYTNSGAGHLAAARALKDAFNQIGIKQVELVDFAVKYRIPIFRKSQKTYKFILENTIFLQKWFVKFFDLFLPWYIFRKTYTLLSVGNIKKFLNEYPADLYVSTYYADTEVFHAIKKHNPELKTIMVVVDIVYALRLWFDPITDLIIVPTQEVYDRGYKYFKKYSDKIELFGLPIAQNVFNKISRHELKLRLGLNENQMIFIAGGGEGMEQVPKIVREIDLINNGLTICVVCGKDTEQKEYLEKQKYNNVVKVFGWVDNFTEFILASDIVITKAGPATVWETLSAGRKMILYGFIGGVEDGDVVFAKKNGDIVYEKNPKKIASLIKSIITRPDPVVPKQFLTNWAQKIVERIDKFMNL